MENARKSAAVPRPVRFAARRLLKSAVRMFSHRSDLFLLLALLLVILSGVLSFRIWLEIDASDRDIRTSLNIADRSGSLVAALTDAETGQRGFLLTGRESYLQPYRSGESRAATELTALQQAVGFFPPQRARVEAVIPLVNQKLEVLRATVALQQRSGPDAALKIIDTDVGKQLMDRIREICQQIQSSEYSRLIDRDRKVAQARDILTTSVAGGSLFVLLAAVLALIDSENRRALARSDATIRTLIETAPEGILATDVNGAIVVANPAATETFGYSSRELIGQPLELLLPRDSRDRHSKSLRDLFVNRPNGLMGLGLPGRRKDGSQFPVEVSLSHIETPEGRLGVAFITDITERRRAEEMLRLSESRYRGLFENMNEGFAYCEMIFESGVGTDYIYRAVNRQFEALIGHENIVGKRISEVNPGIRELDPDLLKMLADVAQTGIPGKFEIFVHVLKRWYSISAYSPERGFFVAIVENISERRQTEAALRRAEERLRLALDSTGLCTFDFDIRAGKVPWFEVAKSHLGLPHSEESGAGIFRNGISADDRHRVREVVEEAMRPGSSGQYSAEFRIAGVNDGQPRWIEIRGRVLPDRSGQPEHLVGVRLDITERKRAAMALAESRDEIRALAASLLTAQEDERRRVSRELHDQICQSLSSLAFDMGALADSPPARGEMSGRLQALRLRVTRTAEEARHLAHRLHASAVDNLGLPAALRSLCRQFSVREGIVLEFNNGVMPVSVPPDVAFCLYRIAEESLRNIVKHAGAHYVSVALSFQNRCMVLTVEDDGSGFDMAAVKGRGRLGLTGMEERARMAKGQFTIGTEPGRGTRIAVEIPLPADNAPAMLRPSPPFSGIQSSPANPQLLPQPSGKPRRK